MLKYVYINVGGVDKKIPCSAEEGNLPRFFGAWETEENYAEKLRQHEAYLEFCEEQERKRDEYENLFCSNLGLFLENYDKIIDNPCFYNILWPHRLAGSMYFDFKSMRTIRLGELLEIYKKESQYSAVCPKCGGKMYLKFFIFSPLSGSIFRAYYICIDCNEEIEDRESIWKHGSPIGFVDIREKYRAKHLNTKPYHITQLIKFLKAGILPNKSDDEYYLPIYHNDLGQGGFMIRGKGDVITFADNDETSNPMEIPGYRRIDEDVPTDVNVCIPERAWTENFIAAMIRAGCSYNDIPKKFRTSEFIKRLINEENLDVPHLATISPSERTLEICIAALKKYSYKKFNRLLKFVPEEIRSEVEEIFADYKVT